MDYDYSPSMSYFDFTDKKILYYPPLSDDEGSRDQFISMDLDGENQTQLIQFTEDQNAGVINVNEKNIYYYLYDSESGYYICSMNLDGLNKKELSITNDKVSDLSGALNGTSFSICGNWLFAINSDENLYFEVKKYDLNEIFQ